MRDPFQDARERVSTAGKVGLLSVEPYTFSLMGEGVCPRGDDARKLVTCERRPYVARRHGGAS